MDGGLGNNLCHRGGRGGHGGSVLHHDFGKDEARKDITLFGNILKEIRLEFPDIWDEETVRTMMDTAVTQEIEWSNHILGSRIPGMNRQTTEDYTKWLANGRLAMIGLGPLYPDAVTNPYKHLDRLQDTNGDRSNFFESTVVNYTQSSSMNGSWDF